MKFGVIVNDKLNGKLQLDFADDASSLAPMAKPLILAIVGGAGAMLAFGRRLDQDDILKIIAFVDTLSQD